MGYGVLTDGVFWSIFDLNNRGEFKDKEIAYFSLLNSPKEYCVENLKKLYRRNVLQVAIDLTPARDSDRDIPKKA